MPNTKTAREEMRKAERRRLRNKPVRSLVKTDIKKAEGLIYSGDLQSAQGAVTAAISSLDKAAEKGIIHPHNAARRKSRLVKKLNMAMAPPVAEVEPEETGEG